MEELQMAAHTIGKSSGIQKLSAILADETVPVRIGHFAQVCLEAEGNTWSTTGFDFEFDTKNPEVDLDLSRVYKIWGVRHGPRDQIFAFLHYLFREGRAELDIPAGEHETNIVIGYVPDLDLVLFIKHGIERGIEVINFKARRPPDLKNDRAKILRFK